MSQPPENPPPPDWAVQYARGAIRIGIGVPKIVEHLVSQGLPADVADRIVIGIIAEDVPDETGSDRSKAIPLVLSALIAGACLGLAYWFGGNPSAGFAAIWVLPELSVIWFLELTDAVESESLAPLWLCSWAILLIYFCYRIFLMVMMS